MLSSRSNGLNRNGELSCIVYSALSPLNLYYEAILAWDQHLYKLKHHKRAWVLKGINETMTLYFLSLMIQPITSRTFRPISTRDALFQKVDELAELLSQDLEEKRIKVRMFSLCNHILLYLRVYLNRAKQLGSSLS